MKLSNGKLAAIIILLVIVVDQALKIWVKTHFYYGEQYEILPWFKLQFIENNGMAFGMEFGSKLLLTTIRLVFVALFCVYLYRLRNRTDVPKGYVVCVATITAGALGNLIDCMAYGLIFNSPAPPEVAQMFPAEGGYAPVMLGRVVDMLYFPPVLLAMARLAARDWRRPLLVLPADFQHCRRCPHRQCHHPHPLLRALPVCHSQKQ